MTYGAVIHKKLKIESKEVQKVIAAITDAGGDAYIVGGWVRDSVMGRVSKDMDIEVYNMRPEKIEAVLAAYGPVQAVGAAFGVLKVRLRDGQELDVSVPRRESVISGQEGVRRGFIVDFDPTMTVEEAAARRDYTINSMMYHAVSGAIVDPYGGYEDLQSGTLRHTSSHFAEDALRVLRGMQFAARWGLTMTPATAELGRSLVPYYGQLPVDRVREEWLKMLKGDYPSKGIEILQQTGWIDLYPELVDMAMTPQDRDWHPEGDVLTHAKQAMDKAAYIAGRDGLAEGDRIILVLAALVHDIGKPVTTSQDERGHIISPGHAAAGVPIAEAFCASIGMPNYIVEQVLPMVAEHMCHVGIDTPNRRIINRLASRMGSATIERLVQLCEADASGRYPAPPASPMASWLPMAAEAQVTTSTVTPLVQGRDLIERGWKPGKHFKPVLEAAMEAQLDDQFCDYEGAIAWLEARIAAV